MKSRRKKLSSEWNAYEANKWKKRRAEEVGYASIIHILVYSYHLWNNRRGVYKSMKSPCTNQVSIVSRWNNQIGKNCTDYYAQSRKGEKSFFLKYPRHKVHFVFRGEDEIKRPNREGARRGGLRHLFINRCHRTWVALSVALSYWLEQSMISLLC